MVFDGLRAAIRAALGLYPTLDLHGLGVQEALAATEAFVRDARAAGVPTVRIVYGKGKRSPRGRGVLRHVVPQWLDGEGAELVERYERRPDQSGADGYLIAWLRLS
jgi:DNA-nicking Smr family endonuclease